MVPICRQVTAYGSVWWNTKSIIDRLICEQYLQYSQQKLPKNNTNFGRAVERERSELRNASPKERKSQVWKQKLSKKWSQGILGGSRERILPTCGPSLITPKGQRKDPDASDDIKTKTKEIKNNSTPHTEPKWPTRWSAVNLPNWLLHLYLADLLVLLLLEVVVEVEVVE